MLPGPPEGAVELSFDAIHEGWSIYRTKDSVLIKVRNIVLKFVLAGIKEDGTAQLALAGNLLFAVTAPQGMKGKPDNEMKTNEQIAAAIVDRNVPFDTVKEDWNEYDVEGIKVGIKVVVTVIAKTRLFDGSGEPLYHVNYQNVLRAITAPGDKAKFLKTWEERGPKTPSA